MYKHTFKVESPQCETCGRIIEEEATFYTEDAGDWQSSELVYCEDCYEDLYCDNCGELNEDCECEEDE